MTRTIYALSSGRPPAAIAIVRVSGPAARAAATALAGDLPTPRVASLRRLRDNDGATLDRALVLFFPGPHTATGEDLVELHLHGGRAVVAAVETALAALPGLHPAEPGEFTRRALANGRLDLAQAEGLADLLEAETEMQRRAALAMAEGGLSQIVERWLREVSTIAAYVEAELDFSDEGDVASASHFDVLAAVKPLLETMEDMLARSPVERLHDGLVVVLAGPRNAGKSSLFNALLGRDAAIVTDIAGTTRDILEAAVTRRGVPFRLVDTAGLAQSTDDPVEAIGISRARDALLIADVVLWLGDAAAAPHGAISVHARADLSSSPTPQSDIATSIHDAATVERLWEMLHEKASLSFVDGRFPMLRRRHRELIAEAVFQLAAMSSVDLLLDAECLRLAARSLAAVTGANATEAMLDTLFARFCVGK